MPRQVSFTDMPMSDMGNLKALINFCLIECLCTQESRNHVAIYYCTVVIFTILIHTQKHDLEIEICTNESSKSEDD